MSVENLQRVGTLREAFEHLRAIPSSMHEHMDYIRETAARATRVLELGVNQGTSCVSLLAGLRPGGRMVSVDIQGPLTPIRFVLEWCAGEVRERNWCFFQADTLDAMARFRDWGWTFDLAFLDSSHQYAATRAELVLLDRLLEPGGVVLAHDTVSFPQVRRAVAEFCRDRGWEWTDRPACHGLGTVRKLNY